MAANKARRASTGFRRGKAPSNADQSMNWRTKASKKQQHSRVHKDSQTKAGRAQCCKNAAAPKNCYLGRALSFRQSNEPKASYRDSCKREIKNMRPAKLATSKAAPTTGGRSCTARTTAAAAMAASFAKDQLPTTDLAQKWAHFQHIQTRSTVEMQRGYAPIAWLPITFERLQWKDSNGAPVASHIVKHNWDAIGTLYFPSAAFKDEAGQPFQIPFHWIKVVERDARSRRVEQMEDVPPAVKKALLAIAKVPAPALDRMSRKLLKYFNAERQLFARVGSTSPKDIEEAAKNQPEISTMVENLRKQMAGSLIRTTRRQFMQDVLARKMLTRRNPAVMHMIMFPSMSDEERVKTDEVKVADLMEVRNMFARASDPRLPGSLDGVVPLLDLKKLAEFLFDSGVLPEQFYVNMARPHAAAEALRTNLVYRTKDEPRDDVQRVCCACGDFKGEQHKCAMSDSLKFLVTVLPEKWLRDLRCDFVQWKNVHTFSVKRQKNKSDKKK